MSVWPPNKRWRSWSTGGSIMQLFKVKQALVNLFFEIFDDLLVDLGADPGVNVIACLRTAA